MKGRCLFERFKGINNSRNRFSPELKGVLQNKAYTTNTQFELIITTLGIIQMTAQKNYYTNNFDILKFSLKQ